MTKILRSLIDTIHEEEREIFLATEENTISLKEFDGYFENIETKQDLLDVLERIGFDPYEAESRLDRALLA